MKKLGFIFALILVASLFGVRTAQAQYFGVSWDSGFQVLNLDTTNAANITITYYNEDGTIATGFTNPKTDTVAADTSNNYYPIHAVTGFRGAVQISSNMPIAVITNVIVVTPNKGTGSYIGASAGAATVRFPLVMKGNNFQTTLLTVQNVGGTAAQATFTFVKEVGSTYANISPIVVDINAGGSYTLDLSTHSSFSAITKWVGSVSAVVTDTANDAIIGVSNTVNNKSASGYALATYNGFTSSGSPSVILPLVMENNSGSRTGISCQNLGTTTDITITYYPEPGNPAKAPETKTGITNNGIAVFAQDYTNAPGKPKFVGSAMVTNSANQPMICVVNQQKPAVGSYSSYEGFDPTAATDTVVFPLVMSKNGNPTNGWTYTAFSVASADPTQDVTVTCDFKPSPGFADVANQVKTGKVVVFVQNNLYGNGTKYIGGAVCTATGAKPIVAILNQTREAPYNLPRDILNTYDAFNN